MSYEPSDADAVRSAGRLAAAGAHSVKLEGGAARAPRIAAIVAAEIPVVGHIGVQPQTAALGGGFKRRDDRARLLADARAVAEAGAFALVLEMVAPDLAAEITAAIDIPTIGIGSGPQCDAQIIVIYDVLGLSAHAPPFVRPYAQLGDAVTAALRAYAGDIGAGTYP
jgi:3-methyl-2-oxobutanoate hydroxymethyltransferase